MVPSRGQRNIRRIHFPKAVKILILYGGCTTSAGHLWLIVRIGAITLWFFLFLWDHRRYLLCADLQGQKIFLVNFGLFGWTDDKEIIHPLDCIELDCHFGGVRFWFVCPGCSRRVGVLYLAPGHDRFRCRYCLRLAYESQNYRGRDGGYYPALERLIKLERTVKRYFWRGRHTRKYRKMLVLENRVNRLSKSLISFLDRMAGGK